MPRIKTYQTVDGITYKGTERTYNLWKGGTGFFYYPLEGKRLRCEIRDDNAVIDRDTGRVVGEYDEMWRHVVMVLEEKRDDE